MSSADRGVRIFCSYRRIDDVDVFDGTVRNIVRDLRALYSAETGQSLDLFLDSDNVQWGDNFQATISRAVHEASFFMPIITANYFTSDWCRQEFFSFYSKCQSLGVVELILPIVLAGSRLISESSPDSIARIISTIHYEDWSDLWQLGPASKEWKTEITRMARKINELRGVVEAHLTERLLAETGAPADFPRGRAGSQERSSAQPCADTLKLVREEGVLILDETAELIRKIEEYLHELIDNIQELERRGEGSRASKARLNASFLPRSREIEETAGDIFDRLLNFDVQIRRLKSDVSARSYPTDLVELQRTLQRHAQSIDQQLDQLVPMTRIINRLESPGLRALHVSTNLILQSLRDLALLIHGWVTIVDE